MVLNAISIMKEKSLLVGRNVETGNWNRETMNNAMMEIREIMMDANNVKSLKDGIALERKTNSRLVKSNAEMAIIILSKENNAMMVTIKILMDVQTVS